MPRPVTTLATSLAGLLLAGSGLAIGLTGGTAGASTVNGVATITQQGSTTYLSGGGSEAEFTLSLPPQAACDGDTASDGYHVYSYLVASGTDIQSLTFQEGPSEGLGLVESDGTYYGAVNTAIGTGQIVSIPNDFEWAPLVTQDDVPLSTLLYSGTSGVWEAGLACANTSGDLTDNWNTQVTFTASNSDPNGFVWSDVPGPQGSPSITSASSTGFSLDEPGSFTVTATGDPAPTLSESGTLPTGVTFDTSTGVLSGTATEAGTFPISFTASNGVGNPWVEQFTLVVGTAPAFTSASSATFTSGEAGSFTVSASGTPAPAVAESGTLPAGVTFDTTTDVLSGTPTDSGAFPVTFTATNGIGTPAVQDFTLSVDAAPVFTSKAKDSIKPGAAMKPFTVATTGYPAATITATALPKGISLKDAGDGKAKISGTPASSDKAGTYKVTLTATSSAGKATQAFALTLS